MTGGKAEPCVVSVCTLFQLLSCHCNGMMVILNHFSAVYLYNGGQPHMISNKFVSSQYNVHILMGGHQIATLDDPT